MVATVSGQQPFSAQQTQNSFSAQAQEVRARNEQTQPRHAPAADAQKSDQRLQSKDEHSKQTKHAENGKKSFGSSSSSGEGSRGKNLNVVI